MTKHKTRVTQMVVLPEADSLLSEQATAVQIVDEGGGEFVEVSQHNFPGMGKICIEPGEWPSLRKAINTMIGNCKPF